MLKVGMIGAGNITKLQLDAFAKNSNATVVAIADLNEELAKERAAAYGIKDYYSDYRYILEDNSIEAVSIATPTFTHCQIVVEALKAGKQVLCEKPPALNVKEAELEVAAARETGNLLMWELPNRFKQEIQFLKKYIEEGNMGKILQAEAFRVNRYSSLQGWFADKSKSGGGALIDTCIHQIDEAMYLMGYPKVKTVTGITSDANNDLVGKIKGMNAGWVSADNYSTESTVESMASGFVTFDNGSCLHIKSSRIMYSINKGSYVDLVGEKGGARRDGEQITLLTNLNDYMTESKPIIQNKLNAFEGAVNHFVDCCVNGTKCICEDWQGVELMKIIEGLYKSAETGQPVIY